MTPKQRAAAYRRAAARIRRGDNVWSCVAVYRAAVEMSDYVHSDAVVEAYSRMFAKRDRERLLVAEADAAGGKEWRITALLFAAAMAETGDL